MENILLTEYGEYIIIALCSGITAIFTLLCRSYLRNVELRIAAYKYELDERDRQHVEDLQGLREKVAELEAWKSEIHTMITGFGFDHLISHFKKK